MRTVIGTTEYTRGYRPHETYQHVLRRAAKRDRQRRRLQAFKVDVLDARVTLAEVQVQAAKVLKLARERGLVHA